MIALPTSAQSLVQNDYLFNDAWTPVAPGSAAGADTSAFGPERASATLNVTGSLPAAGGDIAMTATMVPGAGQNPGTEYLTAPGTNHGEEHGVSGNFAGAPTIANLPAFTIDTSAACTPGTRASHQNFQGICEDTGAVTLTFSRPVTNPVLDISGLGGFALAITDDLRYARGSFVSTHLTIATPGITFSQPAAGATNLAVTPTSLNVAANNPNPYCDNDRSPFAPLNGTVVQVPNTTPAGCGSVTLQGTFTEVTFNLDTELRAFSTVPGAGASWRANRNDGYADGINGGNLRASQAALLPPSYGAQSGLTNTDRFHVSVRLPVGSIGDTVWSDNDRDGIQDDGEPGLAGVTATLVDAAGVPVPGVDPVVTDADGNYLFDELPYGDYAVVFSDLPAGASFTTQDAGGDDALDSDADPATGQTDTVTIDATTPNNLDVDAGVVIPGSLGDTVWDDANSNGLLDPGEAGVPGITATLLDADGNPVEGVDPVVTDDNGNYLFEDLPLGTYLVEFSDVPDGLGFTTQNAGDEAADSDANTDGVTDPVTLTPTAPDNLDVDAGLIQVGSLGDRVWQDLNGDGVQDPGEPGLPGATVTLLDGDGNPVAGVDPITTDDSGNYLFEDLPLGDYQVQFTIPEGTTYSPPDAGDDAADSDATPGADPLVGLSPVVSLTPDAPDVDTVDAGVVIPPGTIGDRVWFDANLDGIQDDGEAGVPGITVTLLDGDGNPVAGVDPVVTDDEGNYQFTDLPMGTYSVQFSDLPDDRVFSPQDAGDDAADSDADPTTGTTAPVTLTPTEPENLTLDAGLTPLGSIGDFVWRDDNGDGIQDADEPGVPGVTVTLLDGDGNPVDGVEPVVTDADGAYLFPNLPLGDYQVQFSPVADRIFSPQDAGDDATDSDADPATGITSTVSLTGEQPDNDSVDAGLIPLGSIGDTVWFDANVDGLQDPGEAGVPGITVTLLDENGDPVPGVDPVVTDGEGNYLFEDIPIGTYTVQFSDIPADRAFTTPDAGDDTLDSDAVPGDDPTIATSGPVELTADAPDVLTVDAGLVPLGSIGDFVWQDANNDGIQDPGEPGVPGVTVTLLDGDGNPIEGVEPVETGPDGEYSFPNLPLGDYRVQFTAPDDTVFSPQDEGDDASDSDADPTGLSPVVSLTPEAPDNTTVDAGVVPTGDIGDTVWLDNNEDGIQDPGEPGVPGITVTLLDENGDPVEGVDPVVTDDNGNYLFEDVPIGTYSVEFSDIPADRDYTSPDAGDDATDSDADPVTGRTEPFTTTVEEPSNLTIDAGLVPLGSIGDTVWDDRDGDGIQDPGEPGVPGVTVTLLDGNGEPVPGVDPVVTDENGNYLFPQLPMGDYIIELTPPPGRTLSPVDAGDDVEDSDFDPATNRSPVITLTPEAPNNPDVDGGLLPSGSIGDKVWQDKDRDGVQDPGEPGVPGVKVTLLDENGKPVPGVDPVVTDKNGNYSFKDLELGDYKLKFEPPKGLSFTELGIGSPGKDSDVDPATGITGLISLTVENPNVTDIDAGLVGPLPPNPGDNNGNGLPATGAPSGLGAGLWGGLAALLLGLGLVLGSRRRKVA